MANVSINQRGKNSFRLRVRYKDPHTKLQAEQYFTVRGTREYAEAQKRQLLDAFAVGKIDRVSSETVEGHLTNWLNHRVAMGSIRLTSAVTYKAMLADFISRFGSQLLVAVKPDAVRAWVMETTALKGASYVQYACTVLRKAFQSAVTEGTIPFNVFDRIERPRRPVTRKERTIPPSKLRALWEATDAMPTRQKLAVSLALETGMRRGELAGLQWGDFNDDCTMVRIKRTVVVVNRKVLAHAPKTESGKRKIALSVSLAFLLRKERGEHDRYLFGSDVPPHPEQLSMMLRRALKDAGIEDMSAHDFRHAHATHLLRNKVPIVAVARRLGHAKVTTTMNIYAHALEEDEDHIVDTVNNLLR